MARTKREINILKTSIKLTDEVETFYEKVATRFGNSAKVDVPKKYIGNRVYVIVLKN